MNQYQIISERDQIWRNELIEQVSKETRLPIPRVMMLQWSQFDRPNKIRTPSGREATLSKLTASAIDRLPCTSRWIFTMSPFPPTIPDAYLEPARKWSERMRRKTKNKA